MHIILLHLRIAILILILLVNKQSYGGDNNVFSNYVATYLSAYSKVERSGGTMGIAKTHCHQLSSPSAVKTTQAVSICT